MQQTITVPEGGHQRLDVFLAASGHLKSREKVKETIKRGLVFVNDSVAAKPAMKLNAGDLITIAAMPEDGAVPLAPHDLRLSVLYEDDACLVINKPRGISVHPASSIDPAEPTILHGALHLLQERGLPASPSEILVHRLDKETTGALLLAKTPDAHLELQRQFADRTVEKRYLALVDGVPTHERALIDAPIGRSTGNRTTMSVYGAGRAREAQTTYQIVHATNDVALLECELHTGRTHQIRVHLKTIGHPVLGDPTYALSGSKERTEELGITALCLHAWKLRFQSPMKGVIDVLAPLPKDFAAILKQLKLPLPS